MTEKRSPSQETVIHETTKIQTLKFHDSIAGNKLEMPRKMFELRCHVRHFSIVPHYQ